MYEVQDHKSLGVSAISFIPVVGLVGGGANTDYRVGALFFDSQDKLVDVKAESSTKYTSHWVGMTKEVVDAAIDKNSGLVQAEMEEYGLALDEHAAHEVRGLDTYMKHD